jgi:hypothetical protein
LNGTIVSDIAGLLGSAIAPRYSLIGTNLGSGLTEAPVGSPDTIRNLIGGSAFGHQIDPKLGPLVNNGGPVFLDGTKLLTQAPMPGSPAINAGDPSVLAGVGGVPLNDQRGTPFTRVFGGRIDMGTVESQPNPLAGDYNFDGVVDAADYGVWRDTSDATNDLRADGNGDGVVNQLDYGVWKTNFGSTLPASGGASAATSVAERVALARGQAHSVIRATTLDIAPGSPAAKPVSDTPLRMETLSMAARQDLLETWLTIRSDEHGRHHDWTDHRWSHEAAVEEPPSDLASAVDSAFALIGAVVEE